MNRVILAIVLIFAPGIANGASQSDGQKCSAFKWKAAGVYAQCLLREDARAVRSGKAPDYSKCERKLMRQYASADRKWACAVEDEAANIRELLLTCAEGTRTTTENSLRVVGVEPGWECTGPAPGGCMTICGDGVRAGDEICDDGNVNDGDGCGPDCVPETSSLAGQWRVRFADLFFPATFASDGATVIMQNLLGQGCEKTCVFTVTSEHCASGDTSGSCTFNLESAGGSPEFSCEGAGGEFVSTSPGNYAATGRDWLSLARLTEPDTTCDPPTFPLAACGDGITVAPEICDDGNRDSGDGCDADCSSDETCGNGITDIATGEECDGQESCNPDCTYEDDCDLSGEYASQNIPGMFLLEDDQQGSVQFYGPPATRLFSLTRSDNRAPGSRDFCPYRS